MASYRLSRLTEDIHRELTDIMRSLKDPRIGGLLSIVKVDLSNDLSHCKVYISSVEGLEATKGAVAGLTSAAGFIRREINLRLDMRRSPAFHFIPDDSIQHSADIAKLLGELEAKKSPASQEPSEK